MEISGSGDNVTISGNIKSIGDFQNIKSKLDSLANTTKSITVNIQDSISMTSSVIGYFNKLVLKDGIALQLRVGNDKLFSLLDDLSLVDTFKVKKV